MGYYKNGICVFSNLNTMNESIGLSKLSNFLHGFFVHIKYAIIRMSDKLPYTHSASLVCLLLIFGLAIEIEPFPWFLSYDCTNSPTKALFWISEEVGKFSQWVKTTLRRIFLVHISQRTWDLRWLLSIDLSARLMNRSPISGGIALQTFHAPHRHFFFFQELHSVSPKF